MIENFETVSYDGNILYINSKQIHYMVSSGEHTRNQTTPQTTSPSARSGLHVVQGPAQAGEMAGSQAWFAGADTSRSLQPTPSDVLGISADGNGAPREDPQPDLQSGLGPDLTTLGKLPDDRNISARCGSLSQVTIM